MTGQDLMSEMQAKTTLLDKAIEKLHSRGKALADAEYKYRVALRQKVLLERDKKTPVSIISDVCRGDEEIARLRFDRDVAEAMYRSVQEAINTYKLEIKILDNQIAREWGRPQF